MSNFTTKQQDALLMVEGFIGCGAFSCGLVALAMVVIMKLYRQLCYRLAVYQVLAACLRGSALALQLLFIDKALLETPVCTFVAFLLLYASYLEVLFSGCVTFHLFSFSVFYKNLIKMEGVYVIISVLLPVLPGIIPFTTDSYGSSEAWCFINNNDAGKIERIALYSPAMVLFVIESIAIVVIVAVMVCRGCGRKRQLSVTEKRALSQMLPLLAYPVISCLAFVPPVVMVLHNAVGGHAIFGLNIADAVSGPFLSLASSLVLIIHIVLVLVTRALRRRKRNDENVHVCVSQTIQPSVPKYESTTVASITYFSLAKESVCNSI